LGIAAIVFSTQVNAKWASGDVQGAQASSRKAKTFAIVTTVVGMAAYVIVFVFVVFVLAAGWGPTSTAP
jgi:t-SNARE complex subunit (syntaxin)